MHNYLTKTLIIMGILIIFFACLSPQTLHAATPLPMDQAAEMARAKAPIASLPSVQPARSTEVAASASNDQEKIIPATQTLGDLDTLAWHDLTAEDNSTEYAKLLALLPFDEYLSLPGIENELYINNKNSGVKESFPEQVNPADKIFLISTQHGERGIYCAACHVVPNSFNEKTSFMNVGRMMQSQNISAASIACDQCHHQRIKQISWQFRGVE